MVKRNIQVLFRLTKAEQQELQKRVKKTGLSQEAYIRSVLAGSVPREPPPADYHGMMRKLNAIGNRINQIAARANTTGFFMAQEYAENVRELNKAILEIQKAVTQPDKA